MTYGLKAYSHYQGSGPGRLIAHGSKEACEAAENALSTCSFCYPGRTSNYSTGSCYQAVPTRVPRGVALPEDLPEWSRMDIHELILGGR